MRVTRAQVAALPQGGEGEMELVFSHIEHLSTTAYPGKPCSVVHTHGCPLGCFYCAAEDANTKRAETQKLVKLFEEGKELIDAVTIAGCEPLMQPTSLELAAQLKERGFDIKLHTTGYYPSALERAVEERLADVVEIDIKAPLDTEKYAMVTGREDAVDRIFQSLDVLSSSQVRCQVTATLAPPVFSHEDLPELAHALSCYGFKKLRVKNYPGEEVEDPWLLHSHGEALLRKGVAACFAGRWSDSN
jgi:pyruvate formate lyase activating enzyme